MAQKSRKAMKILRHGRIRKRIKGDAQRPRLAVFRSARHIYAQVIDDAKAVTLASCSTQQKEIADACKGKKPVEAAKLVGETIGSKAKEAGVAQVVFDRGGYKYHGRVKALAEGARESGLEF